MVLPPVPKDAQNADNSQNRPANVKIICPFENLPNNLANLFNRSGIKCTWVKNYTGLNNKDTLAACELAIICPPNTMNVEHRRALGKALRIIQQKGAAILLLSDDRSLANFIVMESDKLSSHIQFASPDTSSDEIWGRICSILDYSPVFNRLDQYLNQLEQWAFSLNRRFEELHQELRLAWRVQQDFLPRKLPNNSNLTFSALYRPATWVSGDIYDIFTLDEDHIGFYIADVVGHGVAAGLMTLFAKRALVTKEITRDGYRLLSPSEAMGNLNTELCSLELPEHQFITACYGIINRHTRQTTFARGGHPHPVLITPNGQITQLTIDGALLGVMPEVTFPVYDFQLEAGSKLMVFTDGLEQAFGEEHGEEILFRELSRLASLPADRIIDSLSGLIDCQQSSLHPQDDITAIIVEAA